MRKAMVLILILCSLPLFSQPLMPGVNEWPLCFDESEWESLETWVWEETERTVREAVLAATVPLYRQIKTLQIVLVIVSAVGVGLGVVAALK